MTSFISTLSLFLLALVSVCFTLPVTDKPLFGTSSPFDNDVTTDHLFGERMAFDEAGMSSTVAHVKRSSDDWTATETSSMSEDATREPRTLGDMITDESFTFMPTTEESIHHKREVTDSSMVTGEPTTERAEVFPRGSGMEFDTETEVATESSHSKRDFDDSAFTTSKSVTGPQSSDRSFPSAKSELDFTTDIMSSFTSTSSAVAPELYTRHSSTSRKYTGPLADQVDREEDMKHKDEESERPYEKHEDAAETHGEHQKQGKKESSEEKNYSGKHRQEESETKEHKHEGGNQAEEGRKPAKYASSNFGNDGEAAQPNDRSTARPKAYRTTTVESDDGVQYPKAYYDQSAWKNVPKTGDDFAQLDESSDVVTMVNKMRSPSAVESHTEGSQLNQGEESARAQ